MLVMAGAGVAIYASMQHGNSVDYTPTAADDIRLKIYGNANGDDVIDKTDTAVVEHIISVNGDTDEANDVDWASVYPFADANHDGVIDSRDTDVINKIINGESTKMYYSNYYDRVTYVNYPVGQNIGAEYLSLQILPAIHSYSMLKGIDSTTAKMYGDSMFPGIESMSIIGGWREMTVEGLTTMYQNGTINSFMQWTGGQNTDYLWDKAEASGLADLVSIIIIPCQGPECIDGILELACMLGDQSLSNDYKAWYDEAMGLLDSINAKIGEKKTVTVVRGYNEKQSNIAAFGSDQGPALWFNKIVKFQESYVSKTNFTTLGYEGFVSSATDEVIVMFQKPADVDYKDFNDYVEKIYAALFINTDQYNAEKLYAISFEIMPYAAGPAGCYILASCLYPELFDKEKALDFLQTYLDNFAVRQGADAREGYTYTGDGYGTSV